jgi:hypothetical protein
MVRARPRAIFEGSKITKIMERVILYIDILLLTLAIGINSHTVYVVYNSPLPCEEFGE